MGWRARPTSRQSLQASFPSPLPLKNPWIARLRRRQCSIFSPHVEWICLVREGWAMPDRNPRRCRCARRPPRTYCTEETSNLLQRLRAASERDHWQLLDQAPTVCVSIVVLPAQQPAEAVADNRGDEPVSSLVIPDHLQGCRNQRPRTLPEFPSDTARPRARSSVAARYAGRCA
jgi:hypothetical protein